MLKIAVPHRTLCVKALKASPSLDYTIFSCVCVCMPVCVQVFCEKSCVSLLVLISPLVTTTAFAHPSEFPG